MEGKRNNCQNKIFFNDDFLDSFTKKFNYEYKKFVILIEEFKKNIERGIKKNEFNEKYKREIYSFLYYILYKRYLLGIIHHIIKIEVKSREEIISSSNSNLSDNFSSLWKEMTRIVKEYQKYKNEIVTFVLSILLPEIFRVNFLPVDDNFLSAMNIALLKPHIMSIINNNDYFTKKEELKKKFEEKKSEKEKFEVFDIIFRKNIETRLKINNKEEALRKLIISLEKSSNLPFENLPLQYYNNNKKKIEFMINDIYSLIESLKIEEIREDIFKETKMTMTAHIFYEIFNNNNDEIINIYDSI